jgi:hypothetical protein
VSDHPYIIHAADTVPGDVILCRSLGESEKMANVTGVGFSHAAIALGGQQIAESVVRGVRRSSLADLFDDFSYLVVLRQPDLWDEPRIALLHHFVEEAVAGRYKFNSEGLRTFEARRQQHDRDLHSTIERYFHEGVAPANPVKSHRYFCSQFVATACQNAGLIGESGSLVFDPHVIAPDHLIDGAFGHFAGFIVPTPDFEIPSWDRFFNEDPVEEVFGRA